MKTHMTLSPHNTQLHSPSYLEKIEVVSPCQLVYCVPSGEWQGSTFIVTNTSHWTSLPTAVPPHYGATPVTPPTRIVKPMQSQELTTETHVITGHTPITVHRRKPRPRLESPLPTEQQGRKKEVSRMRHSKWPTHARQIITKWTPMHLAASLSIPEVALEWIVEPG
jgi:hypothetical protein